MKAFGKWQLAGKDHECGECVEAIGKGERYMRVVVVEDEAVAGIEATVVIIDVPAAVQQHAARSHAPVLKYHEACWHDASRRNVPLERTILRGEG